MTRWIKQGRLYSLPEGGLHPKLKTHAANPLPVHLTGDVFRIFFCARDEQSRSSVGAVDIDIVTREVVREHLEPFFEFGPQGSFYEAGVSIGNCYQAGGRRYMLFMGWQAPQGGHWRGDIGRLLVEDDLMLKLDADVPLLGSDEVDPVSLAYPWVMEMPGGGFRMWYPSVVSWETGNGEMVAVIKAAQSENGVQWIREGLAVPYALGQAQAFSRPTVLAGNDGYEMWFSYRSGTGQTYRIGYATSPDAVSWTLALSEAGIDVSESGWDSEMIEYPFVFEHGGQRYMLYNGNSYGKTGFGLALG
jgi:hypothetical protein